MSPLNFRQLTPALLSASTLLALLIIVPELRAERPQVLRELSAQGNKFKVNISDGNIDVSDHADIEELQFSEVQDLSPLEKHAAKLSNLRLMSIQGDADLSALGALPALLKSFVAQHRMKLPGAEYVPCYRIVT